MWCVECSKLGQVDAFRTKDSKVSDDGIGKSRISSDGKREWLRGVVSSIATKKLLIRLLFYVAARTYPEKINTSFWSRNILGTIRHFAGSMVSVTVH